MPTLNAVENEHSPEEFGPASDRRTERGFRDYARIVDSYDGVVEVRESSSAAGPHVWVYLEGTCHMTGEPTQRVAGETRGPGFMGAHLTPEQAIRLRDALDAFLREATGEATPNSGTAGSSLGDAQPARLAGDAQGVR